MLKKYNFAVVGATGLVGSTMLKILGETSLPIGSVRALATGRSKGSYVDFREEKILVEDVAQSSFKGVDIALFAGGEIASTDFAPRAVEEGAVVIDNSSAYRQDPQVPLVVPEVNASALNGGARLIANPNCSTIQMISILGPLHRAWEVTGVSVATYQSVSGAGKNGLDELRGQTEQFLKGGVSLDSKTFPRQIAINLFPQIGSFNEDGLSTEEEKMVLETRKILSLPALPVLATCVRVPVFFAHSEALQISFSQESSPEKARELLKKAPDVEVVDDLINGVYPTPIDAEGQDKVLVGRIRRDPTRPNGLSMWVVADNLRKGAATNAVNIA
ncbi:aspartate-semialdehyde dehydrogenase [bacterium]|nr:aspartate-semialdehyde dehydrogenase [bacterium]